MANRRITEKLSDALQVLDTDDENRIRDIISGYIHKLKERTEHHLGYPYNLTFDLDILKPLQDYAINNLGDPFIESNYGVHSREFEIGVLHWFADLWEIDVNDMWGYITNCGTEGNLHGILVGRENHPDGILICSKESHYSVMKAARMYRMDAKEIPTQTTGEMDYVILREELQKIYPRHVILNLNIGTTVKGAVDNIDEVLKVLKEVGYTDEMFYIHCDGALFGMMIPFVKDAPRVTFKKPIGSISVSGHKFIGSPVPCGVVITRAKYIKALSTEVEYLNSRDATIMGSRNGHAAVYLWYNLTLKGRAGFEDDVRLCLENARYMYAQLQHHDVYTMLNELSCTVVFEKPTDEVFIRKWQLACEGPIAHAVIMQNVTKEKIDEFIREFVATKQQT